MTAEQPLNETYRRAIEIAKVKSGKDRGAAAWLAEYLGISRQLLFSWRYSGFPDYLALKVAKLAEANPKKLRNVTVDMPEDSWESTCDRLPNWLIDTMVKR